MIYRHYLVSGRVQGVGFRKFTCREAAELGLKGRTRNMTDGRVEIVACGSADSLEIFEQALSRGPARSSVRQIEKAELDDDNAKTLFKLFDSGFVQLEDGETPWI